MSFLDSVKSKVKSALDAVTGNAATVTLAHTGKFGPGEVIEVTLTVTSTGNALESKAAYIDLLGEDDAEESVVEKARELVTRKTDPHFSYEIAGATTLAAGETKTITGHFTIPADLDPARRWLIRGRVQAPGNDPDSDYQALS